MALRAIVLVGGEGTRLRPITFTRPKPILPIGGVAMMERKLAELATHGVTEAVLSLGYKPDAFLDAYPSGIIGGVRVHYAVEPAPLDTAGAIKFAAIEAGFLDSDDDDPIVAVNGDTTTTDLTTQLAFHRARGAEGTIALTQVEDPSAFGVVPIDDDGRVVAFVEKPPRDEAPTDWINAGQYVLERRFFDRIPTGERVSIEKAIFPLCVAEGTLYAVHDPGYWIDAGIPTTYLQANLDFAATDAGDADGSMIASDVSVADDAHVRRSVIGAGSTIGSLASVEESVVHERVHVGASVRLHEAIIGNDVTIGDGAVITGHSVIGDGAVVEAGAELHGVRFPMPE